MLLCTAQTCHNKLTPAKTPKLHKNAVRHRTVMGGLPSALIYFLHNSIHHPEMEITPLKTVCGGEIKKTVTHATLSLWKTSVHTKRYPWLLHTWYPPRVSRRGMLQQQQEVKRQNDAHIATLTCSLLSTTLMLSDSWARFSRLARSSLRSVHRSSSKRSTVGCRLSDRPSSAQDAPRSSWGLWNRSSPAKAMQRSYTVRTHITWWLTQHTSNAEVTHSQDTHYLVTPTAFKQHRGHSQSGHTLPGDAHSIQGNTEVTHSQDTHYLVMPTVFRATQRSLTVRTHITWWHPQRSPGDSGIGPHLPGQCTGHSQ